MKTAARRAKTGMRTTPLRCAISRVRMECVRIARRRGGGGGARHRLCVPHPLNQTLLVAAADDLWRRRDATLHHPVGRAALEPRRRRWPLGAVPHGLPRRSHLRDAPAPPRQCRPRGGAAAARRTPAAALGAAAAAAAHRRRRRRLVRVLQRLAPEWRLARHAEPCRDRGDGARGELAWDARPLLPYAGRPPCVDADGDVGAAAARARRDVRLYSQYIQPPQRPSPAHRPRGGAGAAAAGAPIRRPADGRGRHGRRDGATDDRVCLRRVLLGRTPPLVPRRAADTPR